MGLRFKKSVKIAPGVKINFNKKSTSVTIGTKHARKTFSSTGKTTTTVGIPGTGISYSETTSSKKKKATTTTTKPITKNVAPAQTKATVAEEKLPIHNSIEKQPVKAQKFYQYFFFICGILFLCMGLLLMLVNPICIIIPILGIFLIWQSRVIKKRLKALKTLENSKFNSDNT